MALITGSPGSDTLTGTAEADLIFGRGGADFISGREANDTIFGGSGNDTIAGDNAPLPGACLGAGDAFASGFIYGHLRGWSLEEAARLGNATGAIVVTRHGCANFMPTLQEVRAFLDAQGSPPSSMRERLILET